MGEQVRDPIKYKNMLEERSLVQVMQVLRMKGDKKVMTPLHPDNYTPTPLEYVRRQNTSGKDVLVTFT